MTRRHSIVLIALAAIIAVLLPLGFTVGGVNIPISDVWAILCGNYNGEFGEVGHFIVVETRMPALVTALLAGASLSVAGLLMQTCFNNPLAGPSIMGISSGSSLGVALVLMCLDGIAGVWGQMAVVSAAMIGAMLILGIILLFSMVVNSSDILLIVGILIGYLTNSVISLLNFFSTDNSVHSFVLWGLGTFSGVSLDILPLFAALALILLCISMLYSKSLNALLFGQRFAENVGVSVGRVRTALLFLAGGLTAIVTAWCGPIGFVGLVVPHIARMLLASSNHRVLIPATALCGAAMGLLCQIASVAPALSKGSTIPVNAITPVIGVPVIIYVLLNRKRLLYFN